MKIKVCVSIGNSVAQQSSASVEVNFEKDKIVWRQSTLGSVDYCAAVAIGLEKTFVGFKTESFKYEYDAAAKYWNVEATLVNKIMGR